MNKWCLRLALIGFMCAFLVAIISWIADLAGCSVRSIISEGGILWLLQRWADYISTSALLHLLLYIQGYGIAKASGLLQGVFTLFHPRRTVTYAQRITLLFTGIIFVAFAVLIVYYSWYEEILTRSIGGLWRNTPLIAGHGLLISLLCNLLALLYGFMTERFTSFTTYATALPIGISHYSGILWLYIAGATLYHLVAYAFFS